MTVKRPSDFSAIPLRDYQQQSVDELRTLMAEATSPRPIVLKIEAGSGKSLCEGTTDDCQATA